MFKGGMLAAGLYGALAGALVGLLVVFIAFMNNLTASRTASAQTSGFAAIDSKDPDLKIHPDHVVARIAFVRARSGDAKGALDTVAALADVPAESKDLIKNEMIYDSLDAAYRLPADKQALQAEVVNNTKEIAENIGNAALKADALQRIAVWHAAYDKSTTAKEIAQKAFEVIKGAPRPAKTMLNPWLFIWVPGLAFFGLIFAMVCGPCKEAFSRVCCPGQEQYTMEAPPPAEPPTTSPP